MNKPANLVFIAFFILGGLMWFAASNSFEQYLNHYQITINEQLPQGSKFTITEVELSSSEPRGQINEVALSMPFQAHNTSLKMSNLAWQYEKRSLKKAEVNVERMTIDTLNLSLPRDNISAASDFLIETIESLAQDAITRNQGLNGNHEFQVKIAKLSINSLIVTLVENSEPVEEILFSNIIIPTDNLVNAKMMSIAGTEILTTVIAATQSQLEK